MCSSDLLENVGFYESAEFFIADYFVYFFDFGVIKFDRFYLHCLLRFLIFGGSLDYQDPPKMARGSRGKADSAAPPCKVQRIP